jgi:drug/metabolite transporter (DMT)-like permease
VQVKTLSAGTMNLALSFAMGQTSHWRLVPAALCLGFFCYGLSIVFDVLALRYLGAAREAAFFATAPFVGALAAIPILGESFGWRESGASALMVVGLIVMVTGYRPSDPSIS